MKILVTGSQGFIGARTVRELLDRGHVIGCVDNGSAKAEHERVRLRCESWLRDGKVRFNRNHCIASMSSMKDTFQFFRPDAVVNLAAKAGVRESVDSPEAYVQSNVMGVATILKCMKDVGCTKLIQASTSSVYAGNCTPFIESDPIVRVLSPYAATKLAAEQLCQSWHHNHGTDIACLRYFTVYGPHGRPDMLVDKAIQACLHGNELTIFGDGTARRAFTFVDDVARANALAVESLGGTLNGFNVINVGSDSVNTVKDVLSLVESETGWLLKTRSASKHAADMDETRGCFDRAYELIGWQATTVLHIGIAKAVEPLISCRYD